jgi:hypothetical protein
VSLVWCGVVQRGSSNWCAGRRAGSHVNLSRLKCIAVQKPGVGSETTRRRQSLQYVFMRLTREGLESVTNGQKPIAN